MNEIEKQAAIKTLLWCIHEELDFSMNTSDKSVEKANELFDDMMEDINKKKYDWSNLDSNPQV